RVVGGGEGEKVGCWGEGGVAGGAPRAVDGRMHAVIGGEPDGFWLGPSVLDHVTPQMSCYRDEIFGPVLSVVRAPSYADALRLVSDNPYGNGVAIFTNDGGAARRFVSEVEVGMVGVNVPIPVPMAYYSFGGWKSSLFGDTPIYGTEGLHLYPHGHAAPPRWLAPSPGGVILGSPANKYPRRRSRPGPGRPRPRASRVTHRQPPAGAPAGGPRAPRPVPARCAPWSPGGGHRRGG